MAYKTVRLLLVDKDSNTCEIELPSFMIKQLNINSETIKKHSTKRELNKEITDYLNSFSEDE